MIKAIIIVTIFLQSIWIFDPYKFDLDCPLNDCSTVNQWFSKEHHAIDFDGEIGDPVYAAGRGIIYRAGWNCYTDPCALAITMLHGDGRLATNYWHLNEVLVEAGDRVDKGDLIGTVGITGISSGPHLHLSIQVNREFVDPVLFLDLR